MDRYRAPLAALLLPLVAPLAGCPSPAESETVPPPYPVGQGIVTASVSIASLEAQGWTVCHEETYADQGVPVASLLAECTGSFMLLGCGATGSGTLTLSAAEALTTVTQVDAAFSSDTPDATAHHVANGIGWYFNPDGGATSLYGSWGFFPAGGGVNRAPCDDSGATDASRLCWKTESGALTAGSRCGTELAPDGTWSRYVLVHQGEQAPTNPFASAATVAVGSSTPGTISSQEDLDYYKFTVAAGGQTIRLQTFDSTGATCDPVDWRVDTFLLVYDSAYDLVADDDDSATTLTPGWCEDLSLPLTEGTYYVAVGGWPAYTPPEFPFDYVLAISDATP
jgi:hypothetical protein